VAVAVLGVVLARQLIWPQAFARRI
jgi:hypothetical protein